MDDELNTEILKLKMCDDICKKGNKAISEIAKISRIKHLNKVLKLISNKGQLWTSLKNLNKR